MTLTPAEIEFLAVLVHEPVVFPFGGPATKALKAKGVFPAEILSLQQAYIVHEIRQQPEREPPFGSHSKNPPTCPWKSREEVLSRDRELRQENEQK
jgi:hypothetical protein